MRCHYKILKKEKNPHKILPKTSKFGINFEQILTFFSFFTLLLCIFLQNHIMVQRGENKRRRSDAKKKNEARGDLKKEEKKMTATAK